MPAEQIGVRIAAIYELQSASLEPKLKKLGISWTTFQLLTTIHSAGKSASQIEVANRLGITPATLSETVFSHVQKGLIEQVPSKSDRRVKVLQLTDTSKQLMKQIKKFLVESESVLLADLNQSEAEQLSGFLNRVLSSLDKSMQESFS